RNLGLLISKSLGVDLIECYSANLKGYHNSDKHSAFSTEEFLDLLLNAAFVVTNSFHGVAFSVIFNKQFYAAYNEDSRKDCLLAELQLLSRHINNYKDIDLDAKIDYKNVDINSYILLSKDRFSKELFKNIVNKPNRYIGRLCLIKLDREYLNKDVFSTLYSAPGLSNDEYRNLKKFERKLNRLKYIKDENKISYIIGNLGYGEYLEKKLGTKDFSNLINNLNKTEESSLTLSTIHKAKGTEYENIIILNCTGSNIPYYKNNDIEEERRIFYVALTRGISSVYFITREEEVSPFINEANEP
ncbi:MAG: ATP-binding domain-containing protein, partial [Bacillota bacterium]|nr:ATP-binding domain-containing protein [Bacillota bacterium]